MLGGALKPGKKIWRAGHCEQCHGEGYGGRMGLYEVVVPDDQMRKLVHDGASEARLTEAARAAGPSLLDDGIAKLREGLTTVDEVARVVQEDR